MKTKKGTEIVKKLCAEHPTVGSRAIARILYEDHPDVWTTWNAAYCAVRYVRGAKGETSLKHAAHSGALQAPSHGGKRFAWIPPAKSEYDAPWASADLSPGRWLILPDIHLPFHEPDAMEVALSHGDGCTGILLNGDVVDCYVLSKFTKDPSRSRFADEVEQAQVLFAGLRSGWPKAEIVWKLGNHDERFMSFLEARAPELLRIPAFSYEEVFRVNDHRVRVIGDKRPVRMGKLTVIHGHEYRTPMQNPVNPARGFYLKAKEHILGSHYHQVSSHSEKTIGGVVLGAWSTGCLCQLSPRYAPLNSWAYGFAVVDSGSDGTFEVSNYKIISGKAYRS